MKALYTVLLAAMSVAAGNVQAATISLLPSAETVDAGSPITLDLKISVLGGGTALGTFDLNVGFNPSILSFASASYGDPVLGDELNLEGFGTISQTTPGPSAVEVFELSLDSPGALASQQPGGFTLATLTFQSLAAGTSPLDLSVNALGDQNGAPVSASLQNATVVVTPVPLPATIWSLLSGIVAVSAVLIGRRNAYDPRWPQ